MVNTPDIAIIGAGPAGVAAAVQLKRYGISPLVFEGSDIGGLLKNARLVENYPGFPKGITGPGLVRKLSTHLKRSGIEIIPELVNELEYAKDEFLIKTDLVPYTAQIVIIASGTAPKIMGVPKITDDIRSKILSEIYPIRKIQDKTIVIVGAGDSAFDYALNLAEKNDVVILNRGVQIKALPVLQKEAARTNRIKYIENTPVQSISDQDGELLTITFEREKRIMEIEADYVIFATGREPELGFVSDKLQKQLPGLLGSGKLYLIGDVKNGIYRQTAIAAGDGIRAAMEIYDRTKPPVSTGGDSTAKR